MASFSGRLLHTFDAQSFNLLDLLLDEAQASHVALQLGECVRRQSRTFRRAQRFKPLRCRTQHRLEVANAEARQCALHPVDDTRAFTDQTFSLTTRPFGILLLEAGDRRHAAMSGSPRSQPMRRA